MTSSSMVERAARAAKAEWSGFLDCPGEMYDSEAYRISKAALLAALDLSEQDKHALMTVALREGAPTAGTAAAILHGFISALKAIAQTDGTQG